jgi:hypothetical protein
MCQSRENPLTLLQASLLAFGALISLLWLYGTYEEPAKGDYARAESNEPKDQDRAVDKIIGKEEKLPESG